MTFSSFNWILLKKMKSNLFDLTQLSNWKMKIPLYLSSRREMTKDYSDKEANLIYKNYEQN